MRKKDLFVIVDKLHGLCMCGVRSVCCVPESSAAWGVHVLKNESESGLSYGFFVGSWKQTRAGLPVNARKSVYFNAIGTVL